MFFSINSMVHKCWLINGDTNVMHDMCDVKKVNAQQAKFVNSYMGLPRDGVSRHQNVLEQ